MAIATQAAALFQRHGYTGTGLKEISRQSGAPFGSLYHFFPGGKEQLTTETLRWSGHGYQQLVEAVFDNSPDVLTGLRNCFAGAAEVLQQTDYADVKARVGNRMCLMGNVNPLEIGVRGTPEEVREATLDVLEKSGGEGIVLSVGGGTSPGMPRQNIVAMQAALAEFNKAHFGVS